MRVVTSHSTHRHTLWSTLKGLMELRGIIVCVGREQQEGRKSRSLFACVGSADDVTFHVSACDYRAHYLAIGVLDLKRVLRW